MRVLLLKRLLFFTLMAAVAYVVFSYGFFVWRADGLVTGCVDEIEDNGTGLLLGTSRLLNNGDSNLFFVHRCDAALVLWRAGKIRRLVISGDSAHVGYDEPEWMRAYVVDGGIPDSVIVLDKYGFSTMASLRFCRDSLGMDRITVISQRFHNERAVVLAGRIGIEAVGFDAEAVWTWYGWKTVLREFGARGYWVMGGLERTKRL